MDILLLSPLIRILLVLAFFTGVMRSVLNFQMMSYRWQTHHWSLWMSYFVLNLTFNVLMTLGLLIIHVQNENLTGPLLVFNINWLLLLPIASNTIMIFARLRIGRGFDATFFQMLFRLILMIVLLPIPGRFLWTPTQFNLIFIFFTIIWVIAGYYYLVQTRNYLSTHFTDYTKFKAFEVFPHGVVVTNPEGLILSMNPAAHSILSQIDSSKPEEVRQVLESYNGLYRRGNDTYRINRFAMAEFAHRFIVWEMVKVTQLIDIQTEIVQSTAATRSAWEIVRNILDQLKQSVHEEEKVRLQQYLHDVMGETFSLMSYSMQAALGRELTDEEREQQQYMLEQMYVKLEDRSSGGSDSSFKSLQRSFKRIGVDIEFFGEYPESYHYRHVTYQILREATNNALKHGGASQVQLFMTTKDDWYSFIIRNNGSLISHPNEHGLGLLGMKRLVNDWRGQISIDADKQYEIEVKLPRHEKKSQSALE